MNVLAIDTASRVFSLALCVDAGEGPPLLFHFEADAPGRHSELLLDMIDTLTQKAGLEREALGGVLCMKGPGSFTGLRIGFAAAKGLALALNIPMAAVPTLDCMALPFSFWPGVVLPVIDAKKSCFFTAPFRAGEALSAPMDADARTISEVLLRLLAEGNGAEKPCPVLLTGPDAALFETALNASSCSPLPTETPPHLPHGYAPFMIAIEKRFHLFDNKSSVLYSGPEYIRKSDAELNFN